MRVRYHPQALDELKATTRYYFHNSKTGAQNFRNEVDRAVKFAAAHPERGRQVDGPGVRAVEIGRFRYSLLYSIEENQSILVVSLLDPKRKPGYWKDRF